MEVRFTQNVTVIQLTDKSAAASCAATVPLISLSEICTVSGNADKKESLYTFARNVAYKTIRITGVIREERNIPLSRKKSFLFLLIRAVIVLIRAHLLRFCLSLQGKHHPYRLLRPHNPGTIPDALRSVLLPLTYYLLLSGNHHVLSYNHNVKT